MIECADASWSKLPHASTVREAEQYRRCAADGDIGRSHRDHQRSEAHEEHGKHQRFTPPVMIGEMAEQPSADGTHDKTDRKQDRCAQLLHHRIVAWKERAGEIECKRRIGVKIVPLDKVAGRTDEDRLHAAPHVSELKLFAAPYGRWQGHSKLFYHNATTSAGPIMRICHGLNGAKRKAIFAPLCVPAGTRPAVGKNKIGSPSANPLESLRQLLSSCVGDCRGDSLLLGVSHRPIS